MLMNRGGCFGGKVKTHKPLQIKSMNKHTILYRDEKKKRAGVEDNKRMAIY